MQNAAFARGGYADPSTPAHSTRSAEYQAFAHVTKALSQAKSATEFRVVAEAVYANRKLWNILITDASGDANQLPEKLRADIVGIGLFVQRHSSQVLNNSASIEPLIDINTSIMRGLRGAVEG